MLHQAATQTQTMQGGEEISNWKYSHYFEFVPPKDENIKVGYTLHSVLATKYYQASKTRHQIWSRSTVKFTDQVLPGSVQQRTASEATTSTSAGVPPPPKQPELGFGAKQVIGGGFKKLVVWCVVEETLLTHACFMP